MNPNIEPTLPLPLAHPDYLRVLASWFGVHATPAKNARILDIGCGSGSHLLALAAHLPQAKLVGIDHNSDAIALARQAAQDAGLDNILFKQADIQKLHMKAGVFDYVICNDVYSHVSDDCRSAILKQLTHVLDDNGVAVLSYDTYPGWKIADWWREIMLLHHPDAGKDPSHIELTRQRINEFLAYLPNDTHWSATLRELGQAITGTHPQHVIARILNPDHRAMTLSEFMREANSAGLIYIGDAQYQDTLSAPIQGEARKKIMAQYGTNLVGRQQYYDYLRNRGQRHTLLTRQRQQPFLDPAYGIPREALSNIHIQGGFHPPMQGQPTWRAVKRQGVEIADKPFVRTICGKLNLAGLASTHVATLLSELPEDQRDDGARLILELISAQAVHIHASPINAPIRYSSQPKLIPYILKLLPLVSQSHGAINLANRWQQPITYDPVSAWLMPYMDGSHSDIELINILAEACQNNTFSDQIRAELSDGDTYAADWQHIAGRKVEQIIKWLANQGLLLDQPTPPQEPEQGNP